MRCPIGVVAPAVAFLLVTPGAAQLPTVPIDSGRLVRLHEPTGGVTTGRLVQRLAIPDDSARFCVYPANPCATADALNRHAVPLARINSIDVQDGTHEAAGAVLGAVLGAAVTYLALRPFFSPLVGATLGTVAGGFIGSEVPRWRRAP